MKTPGTGMMALASLMAGIAVFFTGCSRREQPPEPPPPEAVQDEPGTTQPKPPEPKVVEPENTPPASPPEIAAAVRSGDSARIEEVILWAQGLEGAEREKAIYKITTLLSQVDPERALGLVEDMPRGPARDNATRTAVTGLMKSDPPKAMAHVMEMDAEQDRDTRDYVIRGLALDLFPRQVEAAMQLINQHSPGDEQNLVVGMMGSQIALRGMDQVKEWLELLTDDDLRQAGLFSASKVLAGNDQKTAEEWVLSLPQGKERDAAAGGMAAALAGTNPEEAKTMILGLVEGIGRESAMKEVALHLALKNPEPAEEWVRALPEGRSRDRAYQGLTLGRCQQGLEFKPDLVDRVQDRAVRLELERDVAYYLVSAHPSKESAEWVRNSSLPEEEKAELLKSAGL